MLTTLPVSDSDPQARAQDVFKAALRGFSQSAPILIVGHNDADGLSATALFLRTFCSSGWMACPRILGRGENPWAPEVRAHLEGLDLGGMIVTDLGVRSGPIIPGLPTVIVDHHVPVGVPGKAVVITGHGLDPIPTSSLLAYWCASTLADVEPLLWLAAIGLIGDMAGKAGFPEMEEARRRYGITALRNAASLINAPRRSASGDASPALSLLLKAKGPKEITSGEHPETAQLRVAREEVKMELEAAKRIPPKLRNGVALIRLHSPCQIHPLVAQAWRGRLKDSIVLAANTGYRPGWVHFAMRSAARWNLIEFLARHAPPGADGNYGSGHAQATGGALRLEDWNCFVAGLGFGAEEQVAA